MQMNLTINWFQMSAFTVTQLVWSFVILHLFKVQVIIMSLSSVKINYIYGGHYNAEPSGLN